jgi:hypothetical protein
LLGMAFTALVLTLVLNAGSLRTMAQTEPQPTSTFTPTPLPTGFCLDAEQLDPTFGVGGKVTTDSGGDELGRVCKLQPMDGSGDDPHRPVVCGTFLIAGGQTTILLHPTDQPLYSIALSIDRFVERTVSMLIRTPRNRGPYAATMRVRPNRARAVALVAYHALGAYPRTSPATTFDCALLHQRFEHRRFVLLPRRQQHDHQLALSFGTDVDLGGESAAAPA